MKKQSFPGALILIIAIALALSLLRSPDDEVAAQVQIVRPQASIVQPQAESKQPEKRDAGDVRSGETNSVQRTLSENQHRWSEDSSPVTPPRENQ